MLPCQALTTHLLCLWSVELFNLRVLELKVPSGEKHSFSYLHDVFLHMIQASAYLGLNERGFCWPLFPSALSLHSSFLFCISPLHGLVLFSFLCATGNRSQGLGGARQTVYHWATSQLMNLLLIHLLFSTFLIIFPLECNLKDREEILLVALIASESSGKRGT